MSLGHSAGAVTVSGGACCAHCSFARLKSLMIMAQAPLLPPERARVSSSPIDFCSLSRVYMTMNPSCLQPEAHTAFGAVSVSAQTAAACPPILASPSQPWAAPSTPGLHLPPLQDSSSSPKPEQAPLYPTPSPSS